MLEWNIKTFAQLTNDELYDLLKLRIDVFVVEQECYYPDLDNLDRDEQTLHIFAYGSAEGNRNDILAYCRVLAPNISYDNESSIGRVIISKQVRGQRLGHQLLEKALEQITKRWPQHNCHISAQQHLAAFYQSMGFEQVSDMYLEDGIPHIGMVCRL